MSNYFNHIWFIIVIILLDTPISDTKPAFGPKIELTKDTAEEQIRRDSLLFEEVSQGLVKLDTAGSKVENKCELENLSLSIYMEFNRILVVKIILYFVYSRTTLAFII